MGDGRPMGPPSSPCYSRSSPPCSSVFSPYQGGIGTCCTEEQRGWHRLARGTHWRCPTQVQPTVCRRASLSSMMLSDANSMTPAMSLTGSQCDSSSPVALWPHPSSRLHWRCPMPWCLPKMSGMMPTAPPTRPWWMRASGCPLHIVRQWHHTPGLHRRWHRAKCTSPHPWVRRRGWQWVRRRWFGRRWIWWRWPQRRRPPAAGLVYISSSYMSNLYMHLNYVWTFVGMRMILSMNMWCKLFIMNLCMQSCDFKYYLSLNLVTWSTIYV